MSVLDDFDVNPINAVIAAGLVVALVTLGTRWAGEINQINARKDQMLRVERLKVCGTIEDEALRALCVVAPTTRGPQP